MIITMDQVTVQNFDFTAGSVLYEQIIGILSHLEHWAVQMLTRVSDSSVLYINYVTTRLPSIVMHISP